MLIRELNTPIDINIVPPPPRVLRNRRNRDQIMTDPNRLIGIYTPILLDKYIDDDGIAQQKDGRRKCKYCESENRTIYACY